MMDYFRDGGMGMWLILATAIATPIFAFSRPAKTRAAVFSVGCIAALLEAVFGMATGMMAVARHAPHFPDVSRAVAIGLGELANNGTFGAGVAALLGVAALITAARGAEA